MGLTKDLNIPTELFTLAREEYGCTWVSDKITIKRFTYGETLSIQKDAMKIKANLTGTTTADIDATEIQLQTILRAVTQAPWAVNDMNSVKGLPPFIAEWVKNEIEEFNTITVKKKEN